MSDPTPEEILALARFCWPEGIPWMHDPQSFEDHADVAAAEAIFIERGLGEEYGERLCKEVLGTPDDPDLVGLANARVRAMVAVVRAQEEKK